jgi:hypothetical protein
MHGVARTSDLDHRIKGARLVRPIASDERSAITSSSTGLGKELGFLQILQRALRWIPTRWIGPIRDGQQDDDKHWRLHRSLFAFYDYVLYEDERIIIYEKDTPAPASTEPLTLEQAATYLNCTPRRIRALYKSKALSGTRLVIGLSPRWSWSRWSDQKTTNCKRRVARQGKAGTADAGWARLVVQDQIPGSTPCLF